MIKTTRLLQILFQIGNLLRAKCSTSFVPQSTTRFQCRAAYWASNVDLGTAGTFLYKPEDGFLSVLYSLLYNF